MSAALADRILAEIAEDPKSEDDLVVCLRKTSRDVIRLKVTELKRAGAILDRDGIYTLRPGVDASAAVQAVEAEKVTTQQASVQRASQAISAARAQRPVKEPVVVIPPVPPAPLPKAKPEAKRYCVDCHCEKPLSKFVDRNGQHRAKRCSDCRDAAAAVSAQIRQATTKTCTKCRVEKPLVDFYAHGSNKDGKQSWCMACTNGTRVERRRAIQPGASEAPAKVIEATEAARAEAAPADNVLQFPQKDTPPKTLADLVEKHTAKAALPGASITALARLVVMDPVTGPQAMVLSTAGLELLRQAAKA